MNNEQILRAALVDALQILEANGKSFANSVQIKARAALTSTATEEKPTGQVYGIIDPDYGRIYTMVRKLAWEEGYAIGLHGSFTRDLDLIAVPWEAGRNCKPEKLVARILQATGMTVVRTGNPGDKPYGRLVWTLLLPEFGDPRFVDLSIMPAAVEAVCPKERYENFCKLRDEMGKPRSLGGTCYPKYSEREAFEEAANFIVDDGK